MKPGHQGGMVPTITACCPIRVPSGGHLPIHDPGLPQGQQPAHTSPGLRLDGADPKVSSVPWGAPARLSPWQDGHTRLGLACSIYQKGTEVAYRNGEQN